MADNYIWPTSKPISTEQPWGFGKQESKAAASRVAPIGKEGSIERGPALPGQEEMITPEGKFTYTPEVTPAKVTPAKKGATEIPFKREGWDPYGTESAGAFTNIPGLAAQEGWTLWPDKKEGELPRYAVGAADDPRLGMNAEDQWTLDKMKALFPEMFPILTDPKYGVGEIDEEGKRGYTAPQEQLPVFERDRFEQHIMQQLGENPFIIDPQAEMRTKWTELPALFSHVFEGRIRWEDRGRLTKDQRDHWEEVKKQFNADNYNASLSRKTMLMDQYKHAMGSFDERQKTMESLREEYRKQRKEAGEPPERLQARDENGVLTWWNWNPQTRKYEDTGLIASGAEGDGEKMPPKVKGAYNIVSKFAPKVDSSTMMMATMMMANANPNTEEGKRVMQTASMMMTPQFPDPQMKAAYEAALRIYLGWVFGDYLGKKEATPTSKVVNVKPEEMGKGKGTPAKKE